MKNWIPVLLTLLVLGSCTVEKRLYNRGFYVEFRKNPGKGTEQSSAKKPELTKNTLDTQQAVLLPELSKEVESLSRDTVSIKPDNLPQSQVTVKKETRNNQHFLSPKLSKLNESKSQTSARKPLITSTDKVTLKKQSNHSKPRKKRRIELSNEAIEGLLGAALVIILVFSWAFPTFWLVVQAVAAIIFLGLALFCIVWFIVWLCNADFGNFPWFWSGR